MSNVQFEDKQTVYRTTKKKGLTQILINKGIVKNEKSAHVAMLIVSGLAIAIAFFLIFSGGGTPGDGQPNQLPPGQFIPE